MIIDVSTVRTWVQQYLAWEITKQELSKWAYEALHFLLNGEFYKLTNIALYRIIVVLTQVDDYDPCTRADIQQIGNILAGQEDAFYTIHARIKLDYQEEEVQKIRSSFINYKEQFRLTKKEIEEKEDKYLDKLFYLLDCACGENTFCVFINYQAGVPSITLI